MGDLIMVPWAYVSPQPKRHLDRFSRFCSADDRDRPTDRPRYPSVTIGRIPRSIAMRPNNNTFNIWLRGREVQI